jgi:hypothetical protein
LTIEDSNYDNYWDFNMFTLESDKPCSEIPHHEIEPGTYHYTLEILDSDEDTVVSSFATKDGYNVPLVIAENETGTPGEIGMEDGEDGADWFYAFIVSYTGLVIVEKEILETCVID